MLALYTMSQFAGYMTPLNWIPSLYYSVNPIIYWSLATGILIATVLDWFVFAFHPLQKNIFIDQDMYQE